MKCSNAVQARWRPKAREDARQMLEYLADYSLTAAEDAEQQLLQKVRSLAARPMMGRASRFQGMREISMPDYFKIIVYLPVKDGIEIVRLIDTRMKPKAEL